MEEIDFKNIVSIKELGESIGHSFGGEGSQEKFVRHHKLRVLYQVPYGRGFVRYVSKEQAEKVRERHANAIQRKREDMAKAVQPVVVQEALPLESKAESLREKLATALRPAPEPSECLLTLEGLRAEIKAVRGELAQLRDFAKFFSENCASIAKDVTFLRDELTGEAA